ncbi:MAG: hypothetical protein HQK84_01205 [Nitrospinae bacterium]|nr:hypothetical protein [Nitrospinota bacterium]
MVTNVVEDNASETEDLVFNLINKTSAKIVALQVSTISTRNWEENILAGDFLNPGETMEITIADGNKTCSYDILVTFSDNETVEEQNIDLCELGSYTVEE